MCRKASKTGVQVAALLASLLFHCVWKINMGVEESASAFSSSQIEQDSILGRAVPQICLTTRSSIFLNYCKSYFCFGNLQCPIKIGRGIILFIKLTIFYPRIFFKFVV